MIRTRNQVLCWLAALLAVAAFLTSSAAFAADRVVWKKTTVDETLESWKLDMEFHFDAPPDIAHVPIQFEFTQEVYYENSLEDGMDKPKKNRMPMENKQPIMETQDVGFLDPGTGKTMARTRFTFKLTRARGFEAGEYKVGVKNKRSGKKLGSETRLTLNGENEVIDRRSIVFDEKKKKPKTEESGPKEEYNAAEDPNSEEYWSSGPTENEGDDSLPPPAHMQENPGACGCRLPGKTTNGSAALLLLLVGAVATWRRRR